MKTFEHIRTAEEVEADHRRVALRTKFMIRAMATEIAAGELAHAMLRRRIRELEKLIASIRIERI